MEAAVAVNAGHADLEHGVVLAGHEVATDDAFEAPNRGVNSGQQGGQLACRCRRFPTRTGILLRQETQR